MYSGIVYFEEVLEEVKDATGYTNLQPYYDKIRRSIFKAEGDIGSGGLIVRKKAIMTLGSPSYDGLIIVLPEDFHSEYTANPINTGIIEGKILTLSCPSTAEEIEFVYMGWLLDSKGNPYTTRNHLEAVVAGCVKRLYSSRYFTGQGNKNQYDEYKQDYNDMVLMSRGNDAFPTEDQWKEIGKILNGGTFEAFASCGIVEVECGQTVESPPVIIPPVIPVIVYDWQYDGFELDISNAPNIDQTFLDAQSQNPVASWNSGISITYSDVGRINIALLSVTENRYAIYDSLGSDITEIVFDTYYNSDLELQIYTSKVHYTPSTIYFKLI